MSCAKYWRCSQSRSPRERAAKASRARSSIGSATSIPPRIDGIAPSSWLPSRAVKNQHQPDRALRHGRWLACAVMSRSTPATQGHPPPSGKQPGAHTDNDLRLWDWEPQYRSFSRWAACWARVTPVLTGTGRGNLSREAPPPSCACNAKRLGRVGRVKDQLKPIRQGSSEARHGPCLAALALPCCPCLA